MNIDSWLNDLEQLEGWSAFAREMRSELARVQKISDNYYALTVEANAREAKLRSVLENHYMDRGLNCKACLGWNGHHEQGCEIGSALALPTDDTALRERLRQERERCAQQEPVATITEHYGFAEGIVVFESTNREQIPVGTKLYAAPVIPPVKEDE